ncbi:MAG: class I SAM-dependent methyltransferase [Muribaculaceae bacterium]|nr:class I SAM-dependent methyltransferase [Muribaculaceae bacterium]
MEASEKMIEFVSRHANADVNALRLQYRGKKETQLDFDLEFALLQIEARKKTYKKLHGFLSHDNFIFPSLLSAEQATNEVVSRFHASLVKDSNSLLDLTAGLGIDDMTFAEFGANVTACEIDTLKCNALIHNAKIVGVADRIKIINKDSIDFIKNVSDKYDVVFADPARRNSSGEKLHALSDCQPDILASMSEILSIAPRLLVKSSPLLDLTQIYNTVRDLNHIYIVCFKGECKEVLIDIKKDFKFDGVTVIDLDYESEISRFFTEFNSSNNHLYVALCDCKKPTEYRYLYEPNAGIMKTGAWASLISKYPSLSKADSNTHIFLSDVFYGDFPGRVMHIISEPDKKELKALKGEKINIISRNHPLSAPQISKKYSLKSGGERFLYAFRYRKNPTFIITETIK